VAQGVGPEFKLQYLKKKAFHSKHREEKMSQTQWYTPLTQFHRKQR
jgi:hypothetical protein